MTIYKAPFDQKDTKRYRKRKDRRKKAKKILWFNIGGIRECYGKHSVAAMYNRPSAFFPSCEYSCSTSDIRSKITRKTQAPRNFAVAC